VLTTVANLWSGPAKAVSTRKGKGTMNAKKRTDGQAQRAMGMPPTMINAPAKQKSREI
jgi:hypothetical protein